MMYATNTLQHPVRGMSAAVKDWKRIEKENQKTIKDIWPNTDNKAPLKKTKVKKC